MLFCGLERATIAFGSVCGSLAFLGLFRRARAAGRLGGSFGCSSSGGHIHNDGRGRSHNRGGFWRHSRGIGGRTLTGAVCARRARTTVTTVLIARAVVVALIPLAFWARRARFAARLAFGRIRTRGAGFGGFHQTRIIILRIIHYGRDIGLVIAVRWTIIAPVIPVVTVIADITVTVAILVTATLAAIALAAIALAAIALTSVALAAPLPAVALIPALPGIAGRWCTILAIAVLAILLLAGFLFGGHFAHRLAQKAGVMLGMLQEVFGSDAVIGQLRITGENLILLDDLLRRAPDLAFRARAVEDTVDNIAKGARAVLL